MTPGPLPSWSLIAGPFGSGKTHLLVEQLVRRLKRPEQDPRRLLLVLPTRAAIESVRRRIYHYGDLPGFSDLPLVTFEQLPARVGVLTAGRRLSRLQERLLMRTALGDLGTRGPLGELHGVEGVLDRVADQIQECKRFGYLPAASDEASGAWVFPWEQLKRVEGPRDAALLDEFRRVWLRYEELKNAPRQVGSVSLPGWLDAGDTLLLAAELLQAQGLRESCDWLGVDGFDDFTGLQWRLLSLLLKSDPPIGEVALTIPTTVGEVSVDDPRRWWVPRLEGDPRFVNVALTGNHRTESPALLAVNALTPRLAAGGGDEQRVTESGGALRFWEPRDRRREVDKVLRDILVRVHRQGPETGFRHHLIVVRSLTAYRPLLVERAEALGVPLRVRHEATLAEHPLAQRWLEIAALVAGEGWGTDRVLDLLRSSLGYSPMPDGAGTISAPSGAVGRLVEFLRSRPAPESPLEWEALLNAETPSGKAARRLKVFEGASASGDPLTQPLPRLLTALLASHRAYRAIPGSGLAELRGQMALLNALGHAWVLAPWRSQATRLATYSAPVLHGLAVAEMERVGEELLALTGALGSLPVDLDALELLRLALIATIPRVPDGRREVTDVVNAPDARNWEARHVYVLGLEAGTWPMRAEPDLILDRTARAQLSEFGRNHGHAHADWPIEGTHQAVEGWLFQVALSRAQETLTLSCPRLEGGQAVIPSHWYEDLAHLAGGERVRVRDSETQLLAPLSEWVMRGDAERWLEAAGKSDRQSRMQLGGEAVRDSGAVAFLRGQIAGLGIQARGEEAPLPRNIAEVGRTLTRPSASRLNDLAQCRFLFFARSSCDLGVPDPPHEAGLSIMEQGSLAHAALRIWVEHGRPTESLALAGILDEAWSEGRFDERFPRESALVRQQRRIVLRGLQRVVAYETGGAFPWVLDGPSRVEAGFGGTDEPVVSFPLPARQEPLLLKGRIDRIDTVRIGDAQGCVVHDYKFGAKSLLKRQEQLDREASGDEDEGVTYFEQDLQLALYCYAAEQLTGLPAIAALHYPVLKPAGSENGFRVADGVWEVRALEAAALSIPTPEQRAACYSLLAERIITLLSRAEAGEIWPEPLARARCGTACDYAALCRYEDVPPKRSWR